MVCSKCGQELKDEAKFCTKCGANFKATSNDSLPIISFALSGIGIIGYWLMRFLISNAYKTENYASARTFWILVGCFTIIVCVAIIVALLSLKKQKSFLGFIAGIIPCANIIIVECYYLITNLTNN